MADKPIAKTFKGILRVANIQEATDKEKDYYFNPTYYGTPDKGTANETTGYDSASGGLSSLLIRYSYPEDPYKNGMVPITDSLGNYMNINVGGDSVTFGSDELNNGNNADKVEFTQLLYDKTFKQDRVFPVLESEKVFVGMKGRVMPELKDSINSGTITVEESPYYDTIDAKIIVNNNYNHTPSNIEDNGTTYKPLNSVTDLDRKHRTIYQNTNGSIKDYDALVHFQDNIDDHNLKTNKVIDSIVDVVNLKDYVKEKLNLYLGNNVVEVPTGMVIWQYVDLAKWYCIGQTATSSGDPYKGFNPPMGIIDGKYIQDTTNYTPTLYQGVVRKGINRLVALSYEEDVESDEYDTKQLKEIIPLYKRDYALADGSKYTIHLLLPEMSNDYNYPSYDQFINLFFACGYQYTELSDIREHYVNTKKTVNGEQVYGWKGNVRTPSKKCDNRDVLFGIDLLSMLAVKAIYEELRNGTTNNGKSACIDDNGQFSRVNALKWLKTKELPREYIFNTPVPSSSGGMIYKYTEGGAKSPKTYNIEIGLEVNSFNSDLWYYDHDQSKYIKCKVWQTAEVQAALDLFTLININREKELKNFYTFPFRVINLVQNLGKEYKIGTFIGYTPFIWSDQNMWSNQLDSVSTFSATNHPHRHAIFMGPSTYKKNPDYKGNPGSVTADTMARAEGYEHWIEGEQTKKSYEWNLNSYTMAEMKNLKYTYEIRDGIATKVIQWNGQTSPTNPDPRWRDAEPNRGITSPPIDQGIVNQKLKAATANSASGEVKWFQPESIQMVPLIKL